MRFPLPFAAILPALFAAMPAVAQNAPPSFPTKDVSVVYKTHNGPAVQMSWLVADQRVRIVVTGGPGAMLVDVRGRKGFILLDDQKAAMEMPQGDVPVPTGQVPEGAKVTKGKTETVAGNACTVWLVEYQGTRSRSCVTSDGVMLRTGADSGPAGLEATKVIYGAMDAALFRVPDGYEVIPMTEQDNNAPAAR